MRLLALRRKDIRVSQGANCTRHTSATDWSTRVLVSVSISRRPEFGGRDAASHLPPGHTRVLIGVLIKNDDFGARAAGGRLAPGNTRFLIRVLLKNDDFGARAAGSRLAPGNIRFLIIVLIKK